MSFSRPLLILISILTGCVAGPAAGDPAFQEHLLATIPEDTRVIVPVAFSRDGRNAAWVNRPGDMSCAVRGEWKSKPYGVVC
jgi:hypothetical protein